MSKLIFAPIIGVIVLILQAFGIIIPEEIVNQFVDGAITAVVSIITIIGIFKSHKKKNA